ncbi:IBR domain [Arabidopsis suecica]|uniref:RBR-type E3 ubiquitin transferase n=1 Tax=Arabidopsis suecica TaxID=45249 RepID=A0A8T2G2Z3_ARASU|nr:IBR domain [Arabidopsis suecica]
MVAESASASNIFADSLVYRLFFKGLVSDETTTDMEEIVKAGFGIAICDEANTLLYNMKKLLNGDDVINPEEVEIKALICVLNVSIQMELRNVMICCGDYQIFQILTGRGKPQPNIVHLVEQVQHLRGKLSSTEVVLVPRADVIILAIEAIGGETCCICRENTDADRMFFTDNCFHRQCFSCVNRHVQRMLLCGISPTCLHFPCNSELTFESCSKVLTPNLIEFWKRKIEEDLVPAADKIYCPYRRCSMLMSKTALSRETNQSNVRACVKCCRLFCIDCKVPSHSGLSCADYKKLNPEPLYDVKLKSLANKKKWRQCVQCSNLVELFEGCNHITCRYIYIASN